VADEPLLDRALASIEHLREVVQIMTLLIDELSNRLAAVSKDTAARSASSRSRRTNFTLAHEAGIRGVRVHANVAQPSIDNCSVDELCTTSEVRLGSQELDYLRAVNASVARR
jgi:hypothetical protein